MCPIWSHKVTLVSHKVATNNSKILKQLNTNNGLCLTKCLNHISTFSIPCPNLGTAPQANTMPTTGHHNQLVGQIQPSTSIGTFIKPIMMHGNAWLI